MTVCRIKAKRINFVIACGNHAGQQPDTRIVHGYELDAVFAAHREPGWPGWPVTHRPSGCKVVWVRTFEQARKLVNALRRCVPDETAWQILDEEQAKSNPIFAGCREIVASFRRGDD